MSLAIVYGSTTGNTEACARRIADELGDRVDAVLDVGQIDVARLADHDVLVVGVPTWNIGEMQGDWDDVLDSLDDLKLAGKTVAMFGLGDSLSYPDTFLDALGELWEKFEAGGARLIGRWPTAGYDFEGSRGLADEDHFLGLALDEDQEADATPDRIRRWCRQLCEEMDAIPVGA